MQRPHLERHGHGAGGLKPSAAVRSRRSRKNVGRRRGSARLHDVVLLTDAGVPELDPDDKILHRELARRAVDVGVARWDDPAFDDAAAPLLLVRTQFDYVFRREEVLGFAERAARRTKLLNPPGLLRWNAHKRYLDDLAAKQVAVVPTVQLSRGESCDLSELALAKRWHALVVKPAVSAVGSGLNNVDVRGDVELGGRKVGLVAASDDERHRVAFFTIDPATREVAEFPGGGLKTGVEGEGLCLYRSGEDGALYVFMVGERHGTEDHAAEHWRLEATPDGALAGALVRTIPLRPPAEGCAADDLLGFLYVAVERGGVVRYGAEPDAGEQGECVVKTGFLSGHEGDLEGIAIAGEGDDGVLIVSNQGESEFLVFRRVPPHAWLGKFAIGKGRHDAVSRTDGIALTAAALGEAFPHGLFVAQDDHDEGSDRKNFKLVHWGEVRAALATPD